MELAVDYLREMHDKLKNDYSFTGRKSLVNCGFIARELALRLFNQGKFSKMVLVRDKMGSRLIEPLRYGGRVKWGQHIVCFCEYSAYDPLLHNPVPIENYCLLAFGKELEVFDWVSEKEIAELMK